MFKPNLGFVLLLVRNPIESAAFYSQYLGIKPIEQSPTFVMFALTNGVMLGLWSAYTVEPRTVSLPGAAEICFAVEDVDATYNAWGSQGITIIQKPTDMDFGRTFVAIDPDGHRIRIYKLAEQQ